MGTAVSRINWHQSLQNAVRFSQESMWKVSVLGREHLSADRPTLFLPNHIGLTDGNFMLSVTNRPQLVLAKHEIFTPWARRLLTSGGALKLDWSRADRDSLHRAKTFLLRGGNVTIFAEGTRCHGKFDWFKAGASYLAMESECDVVPVAIAGTRFTGNGINFIPKPGSEIRILLSKPVTYDEYSNGIDYNNTRRSLTILSERLRHLCRNHVMTSQREFGFVLPDDDVSQGM